MHTLAIRNEILVNKVGITQATVRNNIAKRYMASTESIRDAGREWYPLANIECQEIADTHNVRIETVAAVMAQLSPRTRWSKNVAGTRELFATGGAIGHIGANVERARVAMLADNPLGTVKGPKTSAFALNILGCADSVTVDVWSLRIALGTKRTDHNLVIGRVGVYQAIAECFQLVAKKFGESPSDMQAITWIVERNGRHA